MITGNLSQPRYYLPEMIQKCLDYAAANDLLNAENGRYEIDGDRAYMNLSELTTNDKVEERLWEAHKKYLDIHLIVRGSERIDMAFLKDMQLKEYKEASDFQPLDGEMSATVVLREGDFLVCYPEDAHRPCLAPGAPELIKKAVFKILI